MDDLAEDGLSKGSTRPHSDPMDCPTWYDTCNCNVDALVWNIERAEKSEAEAKLLRDACRFALNEWFDRVYPPDIFIGGPTSDPGVNEVREVANRLRKALEEKAEKE